MHSKIKFQIKQYILSVCDFRVNMDLSIVVSQMEDLKSESWGRAFKQDWTGCSTMWLFMEI
jgi:hypothetical protein